MRGRPGDRPGPFRARPDEHPGPFRGGPEDGPFRGRPEDHPGPFRGGPNDHPGPFRGGPGDQPGALRGGPGNPPGSFGEPFFGGPDSRGPPDPFRGGPDDPGPRQFLGGPTEDRFHDGGGPPRNSFQNPHPMERPRPRPLFDTEFGSGPFGNDQQFQQAWLPDGDTDSQIFKIVCVWPFGLLDYGSATLRCKI